MSEALCLSLNTPNVYGNIFIQDGALKPKTYIIQYGQIVDLHFKIEYYDENT